MRVLVLTTSFPTDKKSMSGIFVFDECKRLVEQGIEVTVLAPHYPGSKRSELMGGINVRRFRYMLPSGWQRLCYGAGMEPNMRENSFVLFLLIPFFLSFFLYTIWFSRKADILHCHWSPAGLVGAIVGKCIMRKATIYMEHHGIATTSRVHRLVLSWILQNADFVLANSSFTLDRILEVAKPRRRAVLPPGINMSCFSAQERTDDFYKTVGFKCDVPLLLSVGRFIDFKGFGYLIEAIEILVYKMERPNIQLLIVGDGPLRASLDTMVCEKDIERNIRMVGIVPPENMPTHYSHADIVVAPSIIDDHGNTEGLGLTLIEANACGVPCVASRVGGITDVIEDGVNGLLVEPRNPVQLAEKIDYLLRHPKQREKMGEAGRRIVSRKYNSKSTAERLVQCYEEMKLIGVACSKGY